MEILRQLGENGWARVRYSIMKVSMLAAILALVISVPAVPQSDKASTLNVTVLTQDESPIGDAYVVLHDYQTSGHGNVSENWETRTHADGSFSFMVEPRCYDLFVSQGAMVPYSQRICVGPKPVSKLRIKLHPDPHPRLLLQ
jgi:hypothetical protein